MIIIFRTYTFFRSNYMIDIAQIANGARRNNKNYRIAIARDNW